MTLVSCGTFRNGKLRYNKVDKAEVESQAGNDVLQAFTAENSRREVDEEKVNDGENEVQGLPAAEITLQEENVDEQSNEVIEPYNQRAKFRWSHLSRYTLHEPEPQKNERMAKASLITGILSFIPVIGWIFSILAVGFCAQALAKIKREPDVYGGEKFARTGRKLGIISGIIGAIICVIILLTLIVLIAA